MYKYSLRGKKMNTKRIQYKINMDRFELMEHGPINIVFFGDSITAGGFEGDTSDKDAAYPAKLVRKIRDLRDFVHVNSINYAVGGFMAHESTERFLTQVIPIEPTLMIICFGLNDINDTKEKFLGALHTMFAACKEKDIDTIFMTPNMMNTYVAEGTEERHIPYATKTARVQTDGTMDDYIYSAIDLAHKMGITVCDCYSKWKELAKTEDTTLLLANRINHPIREMHDLFAGSLFETIFGKEAVKVAENDGTMYIEK